MLKVGTHARQAALKGFLGYQVQRGESPGFERACIGDQIRKTYNFLVDLLKPAGCHQLYLLFNVWIAFKLMGYGFREIA